MRLPFKINTPFIALNILLFMLLAGAALAEKAAPAPAEPTAFNGQIFLSLAFDKCPQRPAAEVIMPMFGLSDTRAVTDLNIT